MANFHDRSLPYIEDLDYTSNDIIVEIGSDKGEGSTQYFNDFSKRKQVDFYSVDVDEYSMNTFSHYDHTNFIVDSGSKWAKDSLPKMGKKIKVLYLDNYDWLNDATKRILKPHERTQVEAYHQRGVDMTNLDCQREHIAQMYHCLEYMANNSVIICDDTPYQKHSGIYIGKNGAVVPFLLNFGYKIVYGPGLDRPCPDDNGLILAR